MMEYLPMNAETYEEVEQYYSVRSEQLKPYGVSPVGPLVVTTTGLFKQEYAVHNELYVSVYCPLSLRGKGLVEPELRGHNVITTPECNLESYLTSHCIPSLVLARYTSWPEYKAIREFYGNEKAERSGEYLMKHITEGVNLLIEIGASDTAIRAYMMHPIIQDDAGYTDLANNGIYLDTNPLILVKCMEYRKCANAYLCRPYTDNWTQEDISNAVQLVDIDVANMLFADKMQNRGDFIKHHSKTHKRRKQLGKYFENWLNYLEGDI